MGGEALQEFAVWVAGPPASVKPSVSFLSPSEGQKIKGKFNVTGAVVKGTMNITRVQLRVDFGDWVDVSGAAAWHITLDTTRFQNGNHTLQVRAFDGTEYSDTVVRTVDLENPKPSKRLIVPMMDGWMVVALLATVGALYYVRRK